MNEHRFVKVPAEKVAAFAAKVATIYEADYDLYDLTTEEVSGMSHIQLLSMAIELANISNLVLMATYPSKSLDEIWVLVLDISKELP